MKAQPVPGPQIPQSYVDGGYENTSFAPVDLGPQEIRDIINASMADLRKRLLEIDDEYPPATGELLGMSIDI